MSIDINFLSHQYFYFDKPVPYKVNNGTIYITPVSLEQTELFLFSADILNIDKNSLPDIKIIQMSYLQYICQVLLQDENWGKINIDKLSNILIICLGFKSPNIIWKNGQPMIYDEQLQLSVDAKQFDDIKKIIMYQNMLHYDDSYVNPELQKAMAEVDEIQNKNIITPSLERKMAIITAHCGLSKKEQQQMSYRSHSLLFEEVCGEVEFTTIRPVALFAGKSELDHWIFKKPKNKFDGYIQSVDSYTQSMGGVQAIKSSNNQLGDYYTQQLQKF